MGEKHTNKQKQKQKWKVNVRSKNKVWIYYIFAVCDPLKIHRYLRRLFLLVLSEGSMRKLLLATSASLSVDDARDRIEAGMAMEFCLFSIY